MTGNVQSPLAGLFLSITPFPAAHIWPLRDQMFHRGLCSVAAAQLDKRPQELVGKDDAMGPGYRSPRASQMPRAGVFKGAERHRFAALRGVLEAVSELTTRDLGSWWGRHSCLPTGRQECLPHRFGTASWSPASRLPAFPLFLGRLPFLLAPQVTRTQYDTSICHFCEWIKCVSGLDSGPIV